MSNENCENLNGCLGCYCCYGCDGCYGCRGCYCCDGCRGCDGCYGCYGCDGCDGCVNSFGLKNCVAVYESLFCLEIKGAKFILFDVQVSESRIIEVKEKLNSLLNGWYPKQTNAFELLTQCGNEWKKIDTSELSTKDWNESWKDMPREAITYLQSLPEFNAKNFTEITGLEVNKRSIDDVLANLSEEDKQIIKGALR